MSSMTTVYPTFFTGFVMSGALIMAIGAQNLFVLRQGLKREHVGPIVLFCGCTDALLIAAGVGGVGALLGAMPQLTMALTVGGAFFLIWYGCKAFQRMTAPDAMTITTHGSITLGRAVGTAAAFTLLNPHVYLDTVLLMGAAGSTHAPAVRPIFVAGAATASITWFAALGYGARVLTPLFARPVAWKALDAVVGVVMLTLAATLIARVLV
ncbi:L-lysine exporter family protein LysE/ArgO [Novosphingobium chloroacetimidivorans]|uniref:L-lysine exporter family protein LysE/ArgO n=1 Tax=Novosphingobium chloroacetimidivorans TaxID=1428314 RepID=A0A7W7KE45_9SPHN|nr:LysE family transporter [Novosphingobium chloroacetimidivorans]MBB4861147.1 L-lysine exporter family protein LysE/ArgO [Novosphingobium chloroacetimidivorans]